MDDAAPGDRLILMKHLIRALVASVMCAMVVATASCKTGETRESMPPGHDVMYRCPQCGATKSLPENAAPQAHKCPHCKIDMKPT